MKKQSDPKPENINPKEASIGCVVLIFLAILIWGGCKMCSSDDKIEEKPLTRSERIKSLFSEGDGSHYQVNKWIESNIKDPDSYKHIETTYIDMDSVIFVYTTFTATNSFGGREKATCAASVDTLGNLIEATIME